MTFDEARAIVAPYVQSLPQGGDYPPARGIMDAHASHILGDQYERLTKDAVRKHGPRAGYIYPWNVVDYLVGVK